MTAALALFLLLASSPERPGYFGFALTLHSDSTTQWMFVHDVTAGSPAARAGLAKNDVIVAIDGKPLHFRDDADFLDFIARTRPGDRLRLSVIHDNKRRTVVVTAVAMSDEAYEVWKINLEMVKRRHATG
jgi:S1-C subfamily serine protease